ncbi:hypothetical protein F8S13_01315 [Chloroflexia bacterium SDU3-3]|nr:hypothetical protein F8S13_01315 [Chloroflexia bacterium SDU3-3]
MLQKGASSDEPPRSQVRVEWDAKLPVGLRGLRLDGTADQLMQHERLRSFQMRSVRLRQKAELLVVHGPGPLWQQRLEQRLDRRWQIVLGDDLQHVADILLGLGGRGDRRLRDLAIPDRQDAPRCQQGDPRSYAVTSCEEERPLPDLLRPLLATRECVGRPERIVDEQPSTRVEGVLGVLCDHLKLTAQ